MENIKDTEEINPQDIKIAITDCKEEKRLITSKADKSDKTVTYNLVSADDKAQLDTQKYFLTETERKNQNQEDPPEPPLTDEDLKEMTLDIETGLLVNEEKFDGLANDDVDEKIRNDIINDLKKKQPDHDQNLRGVCKIHTGNIGCSDKDPIKNFKKLGLGIFIYLKILKMFSILFFCLILINIPLYYVYTVNHPEFKAEGLKDMFFKTTIGNIASCKNI